MSTISDTVDFDTPSQKITSNSKYSDNKSNYTMSTENHPSPLPPPCSNICKRTYHEHAIDTSGGPTKKARLHTQSSIRKAIEEKGEPRGLLQYFNKATVAEHQAYLDRTTAEVKENAENEQWKKDQHEKILQVKKHLHATERKQKQREREKKKEISCGLHSLGGTKIKVSIIA